MSTARDNSWDIKPWEQPRACSDGGDRKQLAARRIDVNVKKQLLLSFGTVIASLFGGIALSQLLIDPPVFGGSRPERTNVIQAEKFELVDTAGKVRAALTEVGEDAGLVLFDTKGRAAVLLTVNSDGLTLKFLDGHSNGKILNTSDRAKSLADFWHFSYGTDARQEH